MGAEPFQVIHFLDALMASHLCGQESLFTEYPESSGFPGPCEDRAPWALELDQIYPGSS